ncbi:MAG TPA: trehalose-6-phosphate synthase [Thermoanaerobaculia bacterium]|nr:trehalose-6-phosphate synthase [Thermoanaerobaculia bacterium]
MSVRHSRLAVVSNRLPVAAVRDPHGAWTLRPGSGGLVTAMAPALAARGGVWVGWPGQVGEGGSEVQALLEEFNRREGYSLEPVRLTAAEHELFYLGFANEVLWPLFHDLQSRCTFVPEYWEAFLEVNRKFAAAAGAALRPGEMVWVHDYLLLGVGRFVRELAPEARLGFFLHIPFPPPDIFAKLPWRTEVLRALLAYDLAGFQTVRDRRNFIACLRALLPEAVVRGRGNGRYVLSEGRQTRAAALPIGIDAGGFAATARRPEVAARARALREEIGVEHLLLGVDRLDYTKGIPFKLEAVRRLLRARPDLHRRLALVQVLVPSRAEIPEYLRLKAEVERLVGEINGELGQPGWNPVHYFYRPQSREELVAYYRAASVCLATPLKDGMNLVAKEYCACQVERGGVLVLSEFAGAAVQLADGALLVNPYDILGVAAAIGRACEMPLEERRRRMARLQRNVLTEDVHGWVDTFLTHALSD